MLGSWVVPEFSVRFYDNFDSTRTGTSSKSVNGTSWKVLQNFQPKKVKCAYRLELWWRRILVSMALTFRHFCSLFSQMANSLGKQHRMQSTLHFAFGFLVFSDSSYHSYYGSVSYWESITLIHFKTEDRFWVRKMAKIDCLRFTSQNHSQVADLWDMRSGSNPGCLGAREKTGNLAAYMGRIPAIEKQNK